MPASQAAFPGIPTVQDDNDPSVENCIDPRAQWFIDPTGTKRASSATAYLDSTVMTPKGQGVNGHKLFVLFDAVAVKIIFDKDGRAEYVVASMPLIQGIEWYKAAIPGLWTLS